jgi:hypothetical protein
MRKLSFVYSDDSKCTITGKASDITLEQATKYHKQYGRRASSAIYQKYPKSKNEPVSLNRLIEQLEKEAIN